MSAFRPRGPRTVTPKSAEEIDEIVRKMRNEQARPENYREKSLRIHGLVCARCGREFDQATRHLLTVHHKDHDHHNNPPDGSNWENLCVYCHDDAHSRSVLGEYVNGQTTEKTGRLVYEDPGAGSGSSSLGDLFKKALEGKKGK